MSMSFSKALKIVTEAKLLIILLISPGLLGNIFGEKGEAFISGSYLLKALVESQDSRKSRKHVYHFAPKSIFRISRYRLQICIVKDLCYRKRTAI